MLKNKFADICIKFSMKENLNGNLGGGGYLAKFITGILSIFHTPSMKICERSIQNFRFDLVFLCHERRYETQKFLLCRYFWTSSFNGLN